MQTSPFPQVMRIARAVPQAQTVAPASAVELGINLGNPVSTRKPSPCLFSCLLMCGSSPPCFFFWQDGALLSHCWRTAGALLAHCWRAAGALLAQAWRAWPGARRPVRVPDEGSPSTNSRGLAGVHETDQWTQGLSRRSRHVVTITLFFFVIGCL